MELFLDSANLDEIRAAADLGHDGMAVVRDTVEIFDRHRVACRVLAASLRHPVHVLEAARAGAHCGTLPYAVLGQMISHPLTDSGLARFLADRERAQLAMTVTAAVGAR